MDPSVQPLMGNQPETVTDKVAGFIKSGRRSIEHLEEQIEEGVSNFAEQAFSVLTQGDHPSVELGYDTLIKGLCIQCDVNDPMGIQIESDFNSLNGKCPMKILLNEKDEDYDKTVESVTDLDSELQKICKQWGSDHDMDAAEFAGHMQNIMGGDDEIVENLAKDLFAEAEKDAQGQKHRKKCELIKKLWFSMKLMNRLSKYKHVRKCVAYRKVVHELKKSQANTQKTPRWEKAIYVAWPMLCFMFFFVFQSFMLHVATHYYVYYMENGPESRREGQGMLYDVVGEEVAKHLTIKHRSGDRKGAVTEGSVAVPLWILDASGAIPAGLCAVSYMLGLRFRSFNIGLWVKTFIVASAMAFSKGVWDAVTIIPDSIGWDSCKERLGSSGLEHMRHFTGHESSTFLEYVVSSLMNEFQGNHGKRVRYCADMMVSGHTYFAVLFSISCCHQVSFYAHVIFSSPESAKRFRRFVCILCSLCVLTEVFMVAATRFHYTVDMLAAIWMVCMFWDMMTCEQLAANWSEGFHWKDASDTTSGPLPVRWVRRVRIKYGWAQTETPTMKPPWDSFNLKDAGGLGVRVLPSQSKCLNIRRFMGMNPWERDEVDQCSEWHFKNPPNGPQE